MFKLLHKKFGKTKKVFAKFYSNKKLVVVCGVAGVIITGGGVAAYQQFAHKTETEQAVSKTKTARDEQPKKVAAEDVKGQTSEPANMAQDAKNDTGSAPKTTPAPVTAKKPAAPAGPDFSISTSGVSISAGQTSSYITLQSAGSVYWRVDDIANGVYAIYDNSTALFAASTSRSFRVKTENYAAAGTYKVAVKASTDVGFRSNVTTKIVTVTVGAHQDFGVAFSVNEISVDDVSGQAVAPFTTTRIGGHSGGLSAVGTISHAAGFHSMNVSGYMTGQNSGQVVVTIPPGTPPGDYTIQVIVQDGALTTRTDEFILEIF